jgi:hypothetical protein
MQRFLKRSVTAWVTASEKPRRSSASASRRCSAPSKAAGLSATRRDDGSYDIDPAELRRAFPAVTRNSNVAPDLKRGETPGETRVLQAEIDGLREQVALLKDERDDLRRRLDAEAEERRRVTALLTDQRPAAQPAARRGWWRRLVGK